MSFNGINNRNQIIGIRFDPGTLVGHPILIEGEQERFVSTLIDQHLGIHLDLATAINGLGQICCVGRDAFNNSRAFILTPIK